MTLLEEIRDARHRFSAANDHMQGLLARLEKALGAPAFIDPAVLIIQEAVSAHYNLSPSAMRSHLRTRGIAHGRAVAMALCRELVDLSEQDLSTHFDRERSTIAWAAIKVGHRRQIEPIFAHEYESLKENVSRRLCAASLQKVSHA